MRSSDHDPVMDLIGAIYEAALEPELWPEVNARMRQALSGAHVSFGVVDREANMTILDSETPGHMDQGLFLDRYQTVETNPGLVFSAMTPPLTIADRAQLVTDRDLVSLDLYNDIMRPADLWHGIVLNIHRDRRYLAPLGVIRYRREEAFSPAEVQLLQLLAPHLNRAIRVMLRLHEFERRADAAGEIVDRMSTAIVLTDGAGRVASVNRFAQAILDEADGLLLRGGTLQATNRRDGIELARLIAAAARGEADARPGQPCGVMQVSRPSLRRPLPLAVSPMRPVAVLAGLSRAVSVAFTDPDRTAEIDSDLLARLYGLTRREAAVAVLLLQGRPPAAIASELAMTMNTVRTHIRHLLEKTRTDRLSEVVRLLLRGPLSSSY
jgi:DNA-binding CsgD family transcriptional regulator/PAS domain-containing protein